MGGRGFVSISDGESPNRTFSPILDRPLRSQTDGKNVRLEPFRLRLRDPRENENTWCGWCTRAPWALAIAQIRPDPYMYTRGLWKGSRMNRWMQLREPRSGMPLIEVWHKNFRSRSWPRQARGNRETENTDIQRRRRSCFFRSSFRFRFAVTPVYAVFLSSRMSRQLTLFGKLAPARKVYKNPSNQYEEFVNAFVSSSRCSSLTQQEAKRLADHEWKESTKGKSASEVDSVIRKLGPHAADSKELVDCFVRKTPRFESPQRSNNLPSSCATAASSAVVDSARPSNIYRSWHCSWCRQLNSWFLAVHTILVYQARALNLSLFCIAYWSMSIHILNVDWCCDSL